MQSRRRPASILLFPGILFRLFLGALIAGAVLVPAEAGEREEYLRGYVNSLLDTRFPGLGLRSQVISADGTVMLTSRTCLGPSQKRDVAYLLTKTGRVKSIQWDLSTDCDKSDETTEQDRTRSGARSSGTAVDVYALPEQELFGPLLADPRQPRFSVSYQHYRSPARTSFLPPASPLASISAWLPDFSEAQATRRSGFRAGCSRCSISTRRRAI